MKNQFLILISILCFSCQNQKLNNTTLINSNGNIITEKFFEDNVLKGELKDIQIDGDILKGQLTLTNKTARKVNFRLRDFIFKSGDNYGRIPSNKNKLSTNKSEIPNHKKMTEEELRLAMMARTEQKMQRLMRWFSDLSISGGKEITTEIELKFDNNIEIDNLKFYFSGLYKQLLNS